MLNYNTGYASVLKDELRPQYQKCEQNVCFGTVTKCGLVRYHGKVSKYCNKWANVIRERGGKRERKAVVGKYNRQIHRQRALERVGQ